MQKGITDEQAKIVANGLTKGLFKPKKSIRWGRIIYIAIVFGLLLAIYLEVK